MKMFTLKHIGPSGFKTLMKFGLGIDFSKPSELSGARVWGQ
jgi:hypothetical protein